MSEKCSKKVYAGFGVHYSNCSRAGKLEHEGKRYCAQHYPPNVAAKDKAKHARWDAESKASSERFERDANMRRLLRRFTNEELKSAVDAELITTPRPISTGKDKPE